MNIKELKIKGQFLERTGNVELFEVDWSPNHVYRETSNNCDYDNLLKMINKTSPEMIVIDPDGINSTTLVRLMYDLHENYNPSTRRVQRGGEFVEKYIYHELILQLRPKEEN